MKNIHFSPRKKNLVKTDLEVEKLRLETLRLSVEIKRLNTPWYKTSSFYVSLFPVIIALTAAIAGFATGFFNNQRILNQIETTRLATQRDTLERYVRKQIFESDSLRKKILNLQLNEDSILKSYEEVRRQNNELIRVEMTKQELIDSVSNLLSRFAPLVVELETFIDSTSEIERIQRDRIHNKYSWDQAPEHADSITISQLEDDVDVKFNVLQARTIIEYNMKYRQKAIIYRNRMIECLPANQTHQHYKQIDVNEKNIFHGYSNPTDIFAIKFIYEDLNFLLSQLKGKKL